MGAICTQSIEKDESNETAETSQKNLVQLHGTLATHITVDLVLGNQHFNQHTTDSVRARVCWL